MMCRKHIALALPLLAHPASEPRRLGEDLLEAGLAGDLAAVIADHPAEIGAQRFQRPIGALELLVAPGCWRLVSQSLLSAAAVSTIIAKDGTGVFNRRRGKPPGSTTRWN
jgi:hypothetical protein